MKKIFILTAVCTILISGNAVSAFTEQRKFIGEEFDGVTGLNYLNNRYYNSSIAKFISQDPIARNNPESLLTDPQQLNSYSYARNNPIIYSDPSGEKAEAVIKGLGLIPGAHGFINITPKAGEDLSRYNLNGGDGSHYTIGGYASGINPATNKLKAQINEPGDYNLKESDKLATYPLKVPEGMTSAQYDRKLLESGYNLTQQDLGPYFGLGRPTSPHANSGNTWTQVVLGAGGEVPKLDSVYGEVGKMPYFPYGSGHSMNTQWFASSVIQTTGQAIQNIATKATKTTLNSINSTILGISFIINSLQPQ